jgi:hypothetical protein
MAEITQIFFHSGKKDAERGVMRVYGIFRGFGEKMIEVNVPKAFYSTLMSIAQTAIDLEEIKIKAEILSDNATTDSKGDIR